MRGHDGDMFDDEPEGHVAEDVVHLLEWLYNIEQCVGRDRLLDHKPNNYASRGTMRTRALEAIERARKRGKE